ncbi:MAG: endonuclease/exonuclease/phosphatase family protein [Lewinellaceae bacterium]|nr:endonuclease/exonuclease/phosphatase family protein [Lewinellaceae bacterium]
MKKLLLFALFTMPVFLQAQEKASYKVSAIGFYNMENLFDTINNPLTNDEDFLPTGKLLWNSQRYASKEANMAKVISLLATEVSPDGVALLGVAEVENRKVLEDLVQQPALADRHYEIVHYDSPDERGIDCGLLYQPKYFQPTYSRPLRVELIDPISRDTDFTRDILYVTGLLDGDPVHIMVGHWPSRRGGEKASAWARAKAALVCREMADSLLQVDKNARIIIMGDLNDDPNNKSLTEVLKAQPEKDDLKANGLYNTMYDNFKNGNGTLAYRDSWNLFDQIIISKALTNKRSDSWQFYKPVVFRQPWMFQTEGAYKGYPLRTFVGESFMNGYSDHLPVYILLLKKN